MPKYDETIDPYASQMDNMDQTHLTDEARKKISNVFNSIFTGNSTDKTDGPKFQ